MLIHVFTGADRELKLTLGIHIVGIHIDLILFCEARSLTGPGVSQFRKAGWPVSSRNLPILYQPLASKVQDAMFSLCVNSVDLNSDPHALY